MFCPFDCSAVAESEKVGSLNLWLTAPVVVPTDRPKSARNRCVIELFLSSLCNFDLHYLSFMGVRHTNASDLFPLLLGQSP